MIINPFGPMVHRDIDVDMPIYRIIRLDFFCQMIERKQLYLRNILCWDDPWEIPSRLLSYHRDKQASHNSFLAIIHMASKMIKPLYGSCWSTDADNDAMWRIYSSDRQGVCIQTTARKLFKSTDFYTIEPNGRFQAVFLGPIRYAKLEESKEWCKLYDEEAETYPYYMIPAFIKRDAFSNEKEIRLLLYLQNYFRDEEDQWRIFPDVNGIYVSLHDLSFIEKVTLDPRLDDDAVKDISARISGYDFQIEKSSLYTLPNGLIENALFDREYELKYPKGAKVWLDSLNDFK